MSTATLAKKKQKEKTESFGIFGKFLFLSVPHMYMVKTHFLYALSKKEKESWY